MSQADEIRILALDEGPPVPIVESEGTAHAVVWPGMGAQLRSIHRIELGPGGGTIALRHPAEAVYYVMEGEGEAADLDAGDQQALRPGAMIHVEAQTTYALRAGRAGMLVVGGPSPADPSLYAGVA